MTEANAEASSSTASQSAAPGPTVATHLHALLAAQSSSIASLPYLHAYAPSPKGKGRAVFTTQDQISAIEQIKRALEDARGVLERATTTGGGENRVKLARSLKEISNHQSTVLPTTHSLGTDPSYTLIPSRRILLTPVDLLQGLARSLGLQEYLEDSQFGLLKTSLAIAGSCFVIDIDLETDAVAGNEEDDEMDVDPEDKGAEGKVRLTKITANHVRGDVTGKSEWIARVLRDALERYLAVYNERGKDWEWQVRLEQRVRDLEEELGSLKELDGIAEAVADVGWFEDLDKVSTSVQDMYASGTVYSIPRISVFPTFTLLTEAAPSAILRLRPAKKGEAVPVPPGLSEDIEQKWLSSPWVLEYVSQGPSDDGLVVRRSWLDKNAADGETNWDGLIRVEHLLYRDLSSTRPSQILPFPYTADFVHKPAIKGVEQRWAMAKPGPEAFVVGRIGVPASLNGLQALIELLRAQVVLNDLFAGVFKQSYLEQDDQADEADMDDLLSGPRALPITTTLSQTSIRIRFALPDGQDGQITLIVKPSSAAPTHSTVSVEAAEEISARVSRAVEGAGSWRTLVELVSRVDEALAQPA